MRRLLVISILLWGASGTVRAQRDTLVTAREQNLRMDDMADLLQKQTGYRLWFDPASFDTLRFALSVDRLPVREVLARLFENTPFTFSVDADKNIFITRGQTIAVDLPPGLIEGRAVAAGPAFEPPPRGRNRKTSQPSLDANKLFEIGAAGTENRPRVSLAGYILDARNGEPVIGASVFIENPRIGTVTDQYGFYTLALPRGRYTLNIQSIGMTDTRRQIALNGDGRLNVDMIGRVTSLKNVIVSAAKLNNVRSTQMGVQKLDIRTIRQVPVAFGEADVLKVMLTLPGVKSVGESSTGLNVRGGAADQNLIQLNDATIYNPSHFFGMFSAFNPDVIKDAELYKSTLPARYGGRLSSVLDITTREGDKKKINGVAALGVLTSRLELEGPLVKDKTSFVIGGRRTYAGWLLNLLPEQYKHSQAMFYDANLGITHQINKKNTLYLTGYISGDRFNLNSDTLYRYGNRNLSLKWKHLFTNKFNAVFSAGYDGYQYSIESDAQPLTASYFSFAINQEYFKAHFNYYLSNKNSMEFGLNSIDYQIDPGIYKPNDPKSLIVPDRIDREKGVESALYVSDRYSPTEKISIEGGVRYYMYNELGPRTVNLYPAGVARTADAISGTVTYGNNKIIQTYTAPDFRLSLRYAFTDSFSVKAGYTGTHQFVHVLSNTTAVAPTDVWNLSDTYLKPQSADQYSIGFYKNIANNTIETSVEFYYKEMKNVLDYKSNAILVLNHHLETDVFAARGRAYGVELLIKKPVGKLNGWFSYSYSRTELKEDDPTAGEIINGGRYYPASYDQPHAATMVANYRITHRYSFSLNATYSTGRPITVPIATFNYGGGERTLYGDRNGYRIPDYFRIDAGVNILGNHKLWQKTHSTLTIGAYNLTGRHNPYSVYFITENGVINGYKMSIFGSIIPYANYTIAF